MAKELDFELIKKTAEGYGKDMTAFLRAMISHPSESCEEGEVVACIKAEMEKLGFDEVKVDGLGNVMGFMGEGDKIIAIDSHIDTVGIGNIENWDFDPYKGFEDDQLIATRYRIPFSGTRRPRNNMYESFFSPNLSVIRLAFRICGLFTPLGIKCVSLP